MPFDELGSWATFGDMTPSSDLHDLTDTEQTFKKCIRNPVSGGGRMRMMKASKVNQAWYLRPAIPVTGRKKQGDCPKLEASKSYGAKFNLVSKSQRKRPNC